MRGLGISSVGRVLDFHTQGPRFNPQHYTHARAHTHREIRVTPVWLVRGAREGSGGEGRVTVLAYA